MPTYLCHGFRWHRRAIRIFVILHNLDDAASDWLLGPSTSSSILSHFQEIYKFLPDMEDTTSAPEPATSRPEPLHQDDDFSLPPSRHPPSEDHVLMHSWSPVKLLEEHDPEDLTTVSRPYTYVADYAVRVDLSVDLAAEMARYESKTQERVGGSGWFEKLRDELQNGEEIRWYVVVCGDESRDIEEDDGDDTDEEGSQETERAVSVSNEASGISIPIRERAAGTGEKAPGLRDSLEPPASAYAEPTITRPRSPGSHLDTAARIQPIKETRSTTEPGKKVSGPATQTVDHGTLQTPETSTPRLKKRRSMTAGLKKLFKKKE